MTQHRLALAVIGYLVAGCAFYGYAPESWGRFAWGCVAGSLLVWAMWPERRRQA